MPLALPPALSATTTHLHSALLLVGLSSSLPSLISSPSRSLISTLPLLAVLQSSYLLLTATPVTAPSPSKRKARKPSTTATLITLFLSLLLSLTLGTATLYALLVLFGAPVTSHVLETVGTAAHIAVLAVLPLVFAVGVDGKRWRDVVALRATVDEAFAGTLGTAIGAWLGAVPIPLDWDREWQKWPVTILAGAYAGYTLGKTAGWAWKGKKIPF